MGFQQVTAHLQGITWLNQVFCESEIGFKEQNPAEMIAYFHVTKRQIQSKYMGHVCDRFNLTQRTTLNLNENIMFPI